MIGTVQDVTLQRQTEAQLVVADRMARSARWLAASRTRSTTR